MQSSILRCVSLETADLTSPAPLSPEAERRALLAAAIELARQLPLAALTTTRICQSAGVAASQFAGVWPDPAAFEHELLAALLDEVRDSVAKSTLGMPAGLPRLKLAIEAYLNANGARPTVRALAYKLQAGPAGAAILRSRVAGFTLMMEMELQALHWPRPAAVARLFTAAILEIAYAEHEAGSALPELRETVFHYFDRRGP